jgi:hypothetical protein
VLKKGNFLKACLSIISGEKNLVADATLFPLGSDREESEDQAEIARDGDRYSSNSTAVVVLMTSMDHGVCTCCRAMQNSLNMYNAEKVRALGHPITDEFEIPPWNAQTKLFAAYDEVSELYDSFKKAQLQMPSYRESISDDIVAKKDIYFAMVKHCYETEAWIRVYNGHIKSLQAFVANRGKNESESVNSGNRRELI